MKSGNIDLMDNRMGLWCKGIYRRLQLEDYSAIKGLEAQNQEYTNSKDMCIDVENWEIKRFLTQGKGISYGAWVDDKLVGLFAVVKPKAFENLGVHKALTGELMDTVGHWELAHVLPDYRGNNLQKTLGNLCFNDLVQEWPEVQHLFATIFPYNWPSLKNTFHHGFIIIDLAPKYGGHDRYILYRKVIPTILYTPNPVEIVDVQNYEYHKKLFEKGLVGVGLEDDQNLVKMVFCKGL